MAKRTRTESRLRRHRRVRLTVHGTPEQPRLNVFRSKQEIYAQVIDDVAGNTLVSASTIDPAIRDQAKGLKQAEKALQLEKGDVSDRQIHFLLVQAYRAAGADAAATRHANALRASENRSKTN